MGKSNFERMLQLADEVFASRSDPNQLDINEQVLEHLRIIHPATVSAQDDGNGPVAWLLVIPTTFELMNLFLKGDITERELYEKTPLNTTYDALYLCSAMVLEEYRRKGIMKNLALNAAEAIRRDHPIKALFVWTFSEEGKIGAEELSRRLRLPLYLRTSPPSLSYGMQAGPTP
ncbi:MAG: GNAT family N-acetyltransferase [Cyclobacteriaceae bacterium]|nr:GNAT family N-acetyltransferase [Cyclobacteriaceae bacterium]